MVFNKSILCIKPFPFAMDGDGDQQGVGADSQEIPK